MCAAFSAMGAAVPLPLRPERNYEFEFAMFGGGTQGKGSEFCVHRGYLPCSWHRGVLGGSAQSPPWPAGRPLRPSRVPLAH